MQLTEDALSVEPARTVGDLGPLAWIVEELRKVLHGAGKTLRRFARDTTAAAASGVAPPSPATLAAVPHQLHQSAGALEMVDMGAAAVLLRSMEAAAKAFVQRPAMCTPSAAALMERAGAALVEYLETILAQKPVSALALFPQYREISELAEGEKAHPADLWSMSWRWVEPRVKPASVPLGYSAAVRLRLDQAVLKIVKSADAQAAREISDLSLGLAAAQTASQPSIFWQISAAFFEALALDLLPVDLYVKRLASRILMQYSALSREDEQVAPTLVRDLLFYCAQARVGVSRAPVLAAVREAFGLVHCRPVDYEARRFGRFDPVLLSQTRKRIHAAVESWSQVAGGDLTRLRATGEHFQLLADSMIQLQPESTSLAQGLRACTADLVRSGRAPVPALAMEVATSVLYLQTAYEDLDQDEAHLQERVERMSQRLESVRSTGQPQPLEPWIEELYRRVSDRQILGSVVEEMRAGLAQVEKALDAYFRDASERDALAGVSSHLSQIRGVLSVLGLEQAAHAVTHLRSSIDRCTAPDDSAPQVGAMECERLGNSLSALGFLVDMLSYQPALAKELFFYDEVLGELKPTMGRAASEAAPLAHESDASAQAPAADAGELPMPLPGPLAELPALDAAPPPVESAPAVSPAAGSPADMVDDELLEIFIDEARDVIGNALNLIDATATQATVADGPVSLRRAFHTLKGSSRMVGLLEFGEAAWSMEQLHNAWLAQQKPADAPLLQLSRSALRALGDWVEAIAQGVASPWRATQFVAAASALQLDNRLALLELPMAADHGLTTAGLEVAEGAGFPPPAVSDAAVAALPPEPHPVARGADLITLELPSEAGRADAPTEPMSLHPCDPAGAAVEALDLAFEFEFEPEDVKPALASPAIGGFETAEPPVAELDAVTSEAPGFEKVGPEIDASAVECVEPSDEAVKVIGDLRVGIPLYQVYLSEADEWSRRLSTEISEWAVEPAQPVSEAAIAVAHSMAGSSATVGFTQLSMLARTVERALGHAQLLRHEAAPHVPVFVDAAAEIRRLLQQFAAGCLSDVHPRVLEALEGVLDSQAESGLREQPASGRAEAAATESAATVLEPGKAASQIDPPREERSVVGPDQHPPAAFAAAGPPPLARIDEPARTLLPETPVAETRGLDDDIDAIDALDPDLFPVFEEEALDLLPRLGGALRQWLLRPEDEGARGAIQRVLHTLKGSARLAGALRLGEMAHRMESEIESHGSGTPSSAQLEPLLAGFDGLQATLNALRVGAVSSDGESPATPAESGPLPGAAEVRPASVTVAAAAVVPARQTGPSVRVRAQLLDRLVNQAGEIMMSRSRLEARVAQLRESLTDLTGNLERLRQQLRDVELQAETQMQTRLAQSRDSGAGFDPLEFDRYTRVQELTRMMAESVNDVATVQRNVQRAVEGAEDDLVAQGRQSRELQRDLLRTRMVEFEGISQRLYAVVRQASKDTGKQVRLDITGGSIEMDRGMLDRLAPAFEHLLRNAVVHGIESPEQRLACGKPAVGTVGIELHHSGNDVSVTCRDDGAGLDLQQIRRKAVERGQAGSAQPMSDQEIAQLIFTPGFSTAESVTELAGRGIGMDVVRAEVTALGGRIDLASSPGQGCGFTMVLPLTTAVTQVVMLRVGEQRIGVPAMLVELVRRLPTAEIDAAYAGGTIAYAGESLPFHWCGALLQSSPRSAEPPSKSGSLLIVRSASQRLALHVDEVLGTQEVVVKNLGPQLARLPGLAGMSVLASGAVALIYNPVALANVYGQQSRQWTPAQASSDRNGAVRGTSPADAEAQAPLVLVVDDSITVRRVTQRLLQREGYRVALAADGLQGLERLREELPVMLLSDIEMPRMDGFDLVRNIRADAAMCDLPIVMITSRIGDKHRDHAAQLGVQHYLGKPYSEDELLRLVRRFAQQGATTRVH